MKEVQVQEVRVKEFGRGAWLGYLVFVFFVVVTSVAQSAPETVRFTRDILPIFEKHCLKCHEGWFPKAGLALDSREGIFAGGVSGKAVLPGRPDKGSLTYFISPQGQRPSKMPPGPEALSAVEISLIKRWIELGAN